MSTKITLLKGMLIREHTFETAEFVKGFDYITHQVLCTQPTVILKKKTNHSS